MLAVSLVAVLILHAGQAFRDDDMHDELGQERSLTSFKKNPDGAGQEYKALLVEFAVPDTPETNSSLKAKARLMKSTTGCISAELMRGDNEYYLYTVWNPEEAEPAQYTGAGTVRRQFRYPFTRKAHAATFWDEDSKDPRMGYETQLDAAWSVKPIDKNDDKKYNIFVALWQKTTQGGEDEHVKLGIFTDLPSIDEFGDYYVLSLEE